MVVIVMVVDRQKQEILIHNYGDDLDYQDVFMNS